MKKKPMTLHEYYQYIQYNIGGKGLVGSKPTDNYTCTVCKKEVKHFNIIDGAYSCILCGTPTFEHSISIEDYKNIVSVITKRDISFD